jgi:hypothetical protein
MRNEIGLLMQRRRRQQSLGRCQELRPERPWETQKRELWLVSNTLILQLSRYFELSNLKTGDFAVSFYFLYIRLIVSTAFMSGAKEYASNLLDIFIVLLGIKSSVTTTHDCDNVTNRE